MKKVKVLLGIMMMTVMMFAFGMTTKASHDISPVISTEDSLNAGEEVTINISITNNTADTFLPGEVSVEVNHSIEDLSIANGWKVVGNEYFSAIEEWGFLLAENKKAFAPGETISFDVTGTMEYDYERGNEFTAIVSAYDGSVVGMDSYPKVIEVDAPFPMGNYLSVKRGDKVCGVFSLKANLNPGETLVGNMYINVGPSSPGEDDEHFAERIQLSYTDEDIVLTPGGTASVVFEMQVPHDLISEKIYFNISFSEERETYNEETGQYETDWINYYYDWFGMEMEGGTLNPFNDVSTNDWFGKYVLYVYENGLMTGMNETTFGPTVGLSRAQFATILYRMAGEPDTNGLNNPFPDVPDGQFYTEPAIWAASEKVITGYNNGNFGPNDLITREQMATILYRYSVNYCGWEIEVNVDEELSAFPDAANVSAFAKEGMAWAISEGIITGDGGKINPQGTANRAHCATIISRFCGFKE